MQESGTESRKGDNMKNTQRQLKKLTHNPMVRIPNGKEKGKWYPRADDNSCSDCGVKDGEVHILSCAREQCRICRGQLLVCGGCGNFQDNKTFMEVVERVQEMISEAIESQEKQAEMN